MDTISVISVSVGKTNTRLSSGKNHVNSNQDGRQRAEVKGRIYNSLKVNHEATEETKAELWTPLWRTNDRGGQERQERHKLSAGTRWAARQICHV